MTEQNIKFPKSNLITIIIVSLLIGGLSGGATGFMAASFFSGSFNQWLANPLGIGSLSQTKTDVNQNAGASIASGGSVVGEESATTQAVQKVSPAVVSVIVTKELQQYYNYTGPDFNLNDFFGFPFDDLFDSPQQQAPGPTEKREVGSGTGFIITSDGLIVTNRHVVEDTSAEYSVVLSDGTRYDAQVIARDPFNDIAFLKVEASGLPTAQLGDSDELKIGQTVMAIGFSLGEYSNSVTKGIVSGIGREIVADSGGQAEKLENVIQTDAAINPGNSGGPLINLQGQVIGINTAVNLSGQLIGFAIPINSVKQVIDSVRREGKIVRPYLGVRYILLNSQLAEENNLPYDYGALVIRGENSGELAIQPGSPADKAGLEENDIILELNGIKITSDNPLAKEIAKYQPGAVIRLKVAHDGQEKDVQVELDEYPD